VHNLALQESAGFSIEKNSFSKAAQMAVIENLNTSNINSDANLLPENLRVRKVSTSNDKSLNTTKMIFTSD
jgi:hypothetical protein